MLGRMRMRQKRYIALSPLLKRIKFYFDLFSKTNDNYICAIDLQNPMILLSPNMVTDFALPGTVLDSMEKYWVPLIHPEDRGIYETAIREMLIERKRNDYDIEYRVRDSRGEYCWIRCRGRLATNHEGKPTLFAGAMARMGRRNQADSVTGLLNKYQFEHGVSLALSEYRATGKGGALILLGLDNFKIINETYNRFFGDAVLKTMAREIDNILPSMFILYKLDGDEFGIIYPEASESDVEELFASIQKCLMRPHTMDGKMYFCTISAGTVFYPAFGKDYLVLHKHAEAALDMAKRNGKNRNCIFTKEHYNRWVRSISMRDNLRISVEAGCEGFSLFYQPQMQAKGTQIMGAEALLRWKNPKGRMVAPMEFIPILEETKLIIPVGRWILEEAVKTCMKWQKILPDFTMSVNVSYEQIKDSSFKEFIQECLPKYGIRPDTLILELTESSIVSDWGFVNKQFDFYRSIGIKIAMDDFGTGYSSLVYLKNLSCDIVKVDRAFVSNILESKFDLHLVEYTANLCHSVGMEVCCEGVEKNEEYQMLLDVCNVDMVQGYLFGHPEIEENFEKKFLESYNEQK
jgi:diguanylate cyclase (GGDEF)-like protein